jgi:hypothetical protein
LPERFAEQLLLATNALSETQAGYQQRVTVLRASFAELVGVPPIWWTGS